MSITLNLDEATAQRVLALAKERELTVDQLVTQLVEQATPERPGDEFVRLARRYPGRPDPDWKFNREECWDRTRDQ